MADQLLARIFTGEFQPGTRLPPERRLAETLGVDRTTLRMALKQLQRMGLIRAWHGSGIEVNDYREHGGLEVLAAMFALRDLPLEGSFIVEALDFWLEIFCITAAKAAVRMRFDDVRRIELLLDRTIEAGEDIEVLVAAQVELQDLLAELSGSVLFRMLNNSTRPLFARIVRLLPETVDVATSMQQIRLNMRAAALARPREEEVREQLLFALRAMTTGLRERLLFGTPAPPPAPKIKPRTKSMPRSKRGARARNKEQ